MLIQHIRRERSRKGDSRSARYDPHQLLVYRFDKGDPMTAPRTLAALSLFVLLRCAALAAPPPEAQATALLEQVWRSSGAPGVSAAVALRGKLVFAQGVG